MDASRTSDSAGLAEAARRHERTEHFICFCWGLIALKSLLVVWAVQRYHIPFNPLWVVVPTVIFAAVATAAYYLLVE